MLQPTNGQKVLSLRAGQELDGWKLVSIGIDSASFRNGAAEKALTLDFRRAAPPPPAPLALTSPPLFLQRINRASLPSAVRPCFCRESAVGKGAACPPRQDLEYT